MCTVYTCAIEPSTEWKINESMLCGLCGCREKENDEYGCDSMVFRATGNSLSLASEKKHFYGFALVRSPCGANHSEKKR